MIEYELEYLKWKRRQLALRQNYADTPPGLSGEQADEEERLLNLAWKEYGEKRRFRLTTGVKISEEPFVGRKAELEKIRSLFAEGAGTVFLSGMGGIGKSAIARVFGRRYADSYDGILLWNYDRGLKQILADDGQLGISNLLYTQNKYQSRRRYAREKYLRLMQIAQSEKLLIILDNYNQMGDGWFEELQKIPCDLLVTTRLGSSYLSERGYEYLTVESISTEKDWMDFYRLYTGKEPEGTEWKEIENYRESVLGHTLRMKLALCSPKQEWTPEKMAKSFLSNFRLKKTEIQVLCELSFISLRGIPEEVYLSCTEEKKESLDTLKTYSLVQERKDTSGRNFLSLHPVIAEAVQATWHPNLTRCLKFVEEFAVYARFSWYRPREGDFWLMNEVFALLSRLPEPVAWRYYLYECLSTFLFVWEYFTEAEQIDRSLYECVRSYYGEKHQFTAYMALRVAGVYYDSMRFEESLKWYELSFRLYSEARPEDDNFYTDKADVCSRLARIYEHAGNYEAAHRCLDMSMEAMKDFRKATEEAAPKLWLLRRQRWQYAYGRRAFLYFRQGDLEAAWRELDTGMNLFPMNEFQQVEVGRLKAHLYLAGGEYQKAHDAVRKDLELCIRYQGESVKMTLGCRELLGDILRALGDVQAAQEEYLKVLFILQEKYFHQEAWMERLREKLGDAAW